jgi:hypothetical protein
MAVSIETYRDTIGTFVMKYRKERTTGICEDVVMVSESWFLGQVIMVLLVIGVQLNPGPPVDQRKTDHILMHVSTKRRRVKGLKFVDSQPRN